MYGSFGIVEESVEVEHTRRFARLYREELRLGAIHRTQTCAGIEGPRTTFILDAHLRHPGGNGISKYHAAKRDNAVHHSMNHLLIVSVGNYYLRVVQEGIGITVLVLELDLLRIGHRGISTAVAHYYHLIGARTDLERDRAKASIGILLVDLFH